MIPTFVILKGLDGIPLKRVFMTAEESEILIVNPAKLKAKTFDDAIDGVPYEQVFNFDEDVYQKLLLEWETQRKTSSDSWKRLGHLDISNDADEGFELNI